MYGTIARMRVKREKEQEFAAFGREVETMPLAGIVTEIIYRSDADPWVFYMAVAFESKEAYLANANSPEQHERYLRYRALLEEEPEWHDGEVVMIHQAAAQGI